MKKFSPAQLLTLKSMLRIDGYGGRLVYCSLRDQSMQALQRKGYARWEFGGGKYDRSCWHLTDAALEKAKELFPAEAAVLAEFQRS